MSGLPSRVPLNVVFDYLPRDFQEFLLKQYGDRETIERSSVTIEIIKINGKPHAVYGKLQHPLCEEACNAITSEKPKKKSRSSNHTSHPYYTPYW